MSYQKQNFANGEVLTASQLNHIENGIADVESASNATKGVVDKIIDPTLSLSGKAADAAKVGEAVNAEAERAKGVESQLKGDLGKQNNIIGGGIFTFENSSIVNFGAIGALTNESYLFGNAEKLKDIVKGEKKIFNIRVYSSRAGHKVNCYVCRIDGNNLIPITKHEAVSATKVDSNGCPIDFNIVLTDLDVVLLFDGGYIKYGNSDKSIYQVSLPINAVDKTIAGKSIYIELSVGDINYIAISEFINTANVGKKISILGDSISTYEGYVGSNPSYYPSSDVTSVDDTWWKQIIERLNGKLLVNNSWSGSTVTYRDGQSYKAMCLPGRCENLGTDTENPDIILMLCGTNDYKGGISLGTYTGSDSLPELTANLGFRECYAIMLNSIRVKYPDAKIYCMTLFGGNNTTFPVKTANSSSSKTLYDYNLAIKEISNLFGCEVIDLQKCGIHYSTYNKYLDSSGLTHPNKDGMKLIADYVYNKLVN